MKQLYHQQINSASSIFNRHEIALPITRRFERQALKFSDKPAIIRGHTKVSYEELNSRANQLGHTIAGHHLQDTPIAILSDNGIEPVIAILAVLKAGQPFVLLDITHPFKRLQAIIADAGIRVVLCSPDQTEIGKRLTETSHCSLIRLDSAEQSTASGNLSIEPSSSQPACIVYTSGSTGAPKGICHSHRNIMHSIMRSTNALCISSKDRWLLMANTAHMGGINGVLRCLLNGATIYLFSFFQSGLNDLEDYMETHAITVFHAVPSIYRLFIKNLPHQADFPDLRLFLVGGEAMFKNDVKLFQRHFKPSCKLVNHLGCTEFSGYAEYIIDHDTVLEEDIVPVGYPAEDTKLSIVDENGKPVENGQVGNIQIQSEFLASGYWRDPELTKARFAIAGKDNQRAYQPGDIGKIRPDGCLVFMGRNDSQVHIRGNRVEIIEIETALLNLPEVEETRVIPFMRAENETALAGYIIVSPGQTVEINTIRHCLRTTLPDYMIPDRILLIDKFPLNTNGKVDLKRLPKPDWHEQENPVASVSSEKKKSKQQNRKSITFVDESEKVKDAYSAIEKRLCRIWEKLLGQASVGTKDHFFEIGGDSLRVIKLFAIIEKEFNLTFPPHTIFQFPSITKLATLIEEKEKDTALIVLKSIQKANQEPIFWLSCGFDPGQVPIVPLETYWEKRPDKDVYGISIEEMAAGYVDQIRGYLNDGPYCLGGYSMGGLIALETARQLENIGYEISHLFLVDPAIPGERFETVSVKFSRYLKKIFFLSPKEKLPYILKRINNVIRFSNFPFKHAVCRVFFKYNKPLPYILHMYYAHKLFHHASAAYRPKEYNNPNGKVSIVISKLYREMITEKWQSLCPGAEMHIIDTDDHQDIIKPPWSNEWLGDLAETIAAVREKTYKE